VPRVTQVFCESPSDAIHPGEGSGVKTKDLYSASLALAAR
jgi:hypothetical protein